MRRRLGWRWIGVALCGMLLLVAVFWGYNTAPRDGERAKFGTPEAPRRPASAAMGYNRGGDGRGGAMEALVEDPSADSVTEPQETKAEPLAPDTPKKVCFIGPDRKPLVDFAFRIYCSDTAGPRSSKLFHSADDGCATVLSCPGAEVITCVRSASAEYRASRAWVLRGPQTQFFSAQRGAGLRVWVRDPQGRGVQGAKLQVLLEEPDPLSPPPFATWSGISDEEGRFLFRRAQPAPCDPCVRDEEDCKLSRGEFDELVNAHLWVSHPKFAADTREIPFRLDRELEFVLSDPARELRGRLLDEKGKAYVRADIILQSTRFAQLRISARAGQEGEFLLQGLADESYSLQAYQDGQVLVQRKAVRPGERLELQGQRTSVLQDISINLKDPQGRPVEGLGVFGGPFRGQKSDARGRVHQKGGLEGALKVVVESADRRFSREYKLRVLGDGRVEPPGVVVEFSGSEPG